MTAPGWSVLPGGAFTSVTRTPWPLPLTVKGTEQQYIAAYCRRTGREGIDNWDFYLAFNFFRLAAIVHGVKGRVMRGTAANAQAQERAKALPRLSALAREAMEACP